MFFEKHWLAIIKLLISFAAIAYLIYLSLGLVFDYLGPNPVEILTHTTGDWGLYFLLLTLCITPLRRHFHWQKLIQLRRFLGLWSFAFISLHLFIYILFDHFFDVNSIISDIVERPYIAVGFAAFVIMLPLAFTSFRFLQRKMGRSWGKLHKTIYLLGILALIHYWWLTKADFLIPIICVLVLMLLLCDRVYWLFRKTKRI